MVTTKLEVITLFSKRGQSERKKSFIGSRGDTPGAIQLSGKLKLKQPDFFLLFEFAGAGFFGGSSYNRFALVRAGSGIHIARLDVHERLFAMEASTTQASKSVPASDPGPQ